MAQEELALALANQTPVHIKHSVIIGVLTVFNQIRTTRHKVSPRSFEDMGWAPQLTILFDLPEGSIYVDAANALVLRPL